MWEVKIDLPIEIKVGSDEWMDTGLTYEMTLVCEPDESVGDTTYWISAVGIEGFAINELADRRREKKPTTYWLARNHPLHQAAIKYAMRDLKTREILNDKWGEWLDDRPYRRADARAS
jgi:hypothetical protein